ncbi:MAG: TonB-dependent receptor, partial [Segetibacter sp.]
EVYQGISTRLSYSFDNRFTVEVSGAYSGNNRFEKGKQYDFYPAAGISWNIHNEDFFKHITLLNELKIRGSYGKVGNADPGYYLYNQTYRGGTAYYFGNGATSNSSVFQSSLAYSRVAEKANKLNLGFDVSFSKQRGWVNFDYYNNRQYDLLQTRGDNTSLLGQVYPQENIGINKYFGFELNAGWADKVGSLSYSVSGNLSTVNSRIIYNDEPEQAYPWMARTGHSVSQIRGYVAEGFFGSTNLNRATMAGYTPVAGDVKYKDLNGDNLINVYDQTIIGGDKPLLFYGLNGGLMFKSFDFHVLFQGVANRYIVNNGSFALPFQNGGIGQAYEGNLNRYTPETASTATLPRVTIGTNINNYVTSSLYIKNGNYIRLKNLELGYSFSNRFLSAAKIRSIRVFINGQNLLTASKYNEADPEVFSGTYPLQRIINGGLSVKL